MYHRSPFRHIRQFYFGRRSGFGRTGWDRRSRRTEARNMHRGKISRISKQGDPRRILVWHSRGAEKRLHKKHFCDAKAGPFARSNKRPSEKWIAFIRRSTTAKLMEQFIKPRRYNANPGGKVCV